MISAQEFISAGRALVGVPYVHQGHSEAGVDCIGFLFVAARKAGLDIHQMLPETDGFRRPDFSHRRRPDGTGLKLIQHWCRRIETPAPGCLVFFQFPAALHPQHFGLLAGRTVIHAHMTQRRVVEHGYRSQWVKWTHSIWQVPGVNYG